MPNILQSSLLIVDDEPVNIKLLEATLRHEGFTNIESTVDPRQVIAMYQKQEYDLILLDINMPHMDGFEVMKKLGDFLGSDNYLPVLVLTAQADRETRVRALGAGARDFITKPFDRVEILSRIRNVLEVRVLHKEVRNQNRLLEQKVQERTQELEDTRMEIIRRLGRAAEYRDNETGLHIVRMSHFSQHLGLATGMSEQEGRLLLSASPMHDIGKIGIPDKILLKPGKLNANEWAIMKNHTIIGAEILSGHESTLLTMASIIAATHHEKWDGSGYPYGLSGTDIPLVGRIVALVDVFDALTSVRPYKSAWTVEKATDEIMTLKGKHFDPELVDLFMDILPDILQIKHTFSEPGNPALRYSQNR